MNEIVEKIKNDIPDILSGNEEKLVKDAEDFGRYLGKEGLSTSQVRNIFSDIKKMDSFERNRKDLILLRPKLAYVAGRHGKRRGRELFGAIVDLQQVLDKCIQWVRDENSFQNFQNFFEAILAYHKFYGGKD